MPTSTHGMESVDYAQLFRDAWQLTWRYRRLWLLGLLASFLECGLTPGFPGFPSTGTEWRFDDEDMDVANGDIPSEVAHAVLTAVTWVQENWVLLAVMGATLPLVLFVVLVYALIARAALFVTGARLARHEPPAWGESWRASRGRSWALAWLLLLLFLRELPRLLPLVAGGLLLLLAFVNSADIAGVLGAIAVVLAAGVFALLYGIPLSILYELSQRAVVLDGLGPVAALRRGFGLLRRTLGESLVVWLIAFGTRMVAATVIGVVITVTAVPLVGSAVAIGYLLYSADSSLVVAALPALGALMVTIAAGFVLGAPVTAFLAVFWTLAYLRLDPEVSATSPPPSLEGGSVSR